MVQTLGIAGFLYNSKILTMQPTIYKLKNSGYNVVIGTEKVNSAGRI